MIAEHAQVLECCQWTFEGRDRAPSASAWRRGPAERDAV